MADWHSTVTPPALARLLRTARPTEPAGHRPAYRELAGQIRALVAEGRLPVGSRLPAERELALVLSLSRTTIAAAYDTLREQGYLLSRRGSGSWTTLPEGSSPPSDALHPVPPDEQGRVLDLGVAALPAPQPYLGEAAARAVEQLPAYATGHGHYPTGVPVLREAVARRYTERGLPTTPEQILITTGAMGALHLAQRALVGRGDRVAVEAPSYAHTLRSLQLAGARLVPVPQSRPGGPERLPGWDLPQWRRVLRDAAPRVAYVIPDFHNPTGALIAEEQRRELLAAARTAGTVLLVDETMAELDWGTPDQGTGDRGTGEPPRPMAALDRAAQVVTVGSASKLLWGGLRVGWVRAQPALVRRLATDRIYSDVGTPVIDQLIAANLLAERLTEVRTLQLGRLRASAAALAAALREQLPRWRFADPVGGLTLWVDTDGLSGSALAAAGDRTGVRIAAGSRFGVDGAFEGFIRIPLTVPAAAAAEAARRLAATAAAAGSAPWPTETQSQPLAV
ncbi:DNA-binding transcriptional MocR family regulator [Kitasatospora sp. MAP12-15]|uniref:MocR-like transcription factor YczR n=1 Tax=unclassified Kitasatospora TaxID=2633591 RepID=UPI0024757D9F|nr:PLP-dependent aminotransferase family protein [Kitasatospora sp. MAP12-44]MDH6113537.1 DNA-binding transcriptional MocR family regulator [Kitasatospora sp. MAP12-44]